MVHGVSPITRTRHLYNQASYLLLLSHIHRFHPYTSGVPLTYQAFLTLYAATSSVLLVFLSSSRGGSACGPEPSRRMPTGELGMELPMSPKGPSLRLSTLLCCLSPSSLPSCCASPPEGGAPSS